MSVTWRVSHVEQELHITLEQLSSSGVCFLVGFVLLYLLFVPLSFYFWPLHCLSFYEFQVHCIVCRSTSFRFISLSVVLRVSGSLHCLSFYEFQVHCNVCRSTSFRFIALSLVLRVSGTLHCLSFCEFQVHCNVCRSTSFRFW
jgi:hypothetical protein